MIHRETRSAGRGAMPAHWKEEARDPRTADEWQEAVDGANLMLTIDAAKLYGLVDTDMAINVERCEEILARARRHTPSADAVPTRAVTEWLPQ